MTTRQEEGKSQTTFANNGTRRSIVKPVQCWEGKNGNLHKEQWDAAAEIISGSAPYQIKRMTDVPIPEESARIRDAIFWVVDELRKKQKAPKRKVK